MDSTASLTTANHAATGNERATARATGLVDLFWPLAIVALGLGLRLYGLTAFGLWFDEAHSVHMARLGLSDLVREVSKDIHPPLYFAILGVWLKVAGASEFALRFLTVATGTLVVPLIYALGRAIGGVRLARTAALLVAAAPLLVYYGQEVRMYAPSASLMAALALMAWRGVSLAPPRRWVWQYALLGGASAYFHLFNLLPVIAFNVAYLLLAVPTLLRDARGGPLAARLRPVGWWALAQLGVLGLLLPWFPVMLGKGLVGSAASDQAVPLGAIATDLARGFAVGLLADPARFDWLTVSVWVIGAAGSALGVMLAPRAGTSRPLARGAVFATCWVMVSLLLMYFIIAGRREFAPRYLISALPGLALLVAAGLTLILRSRLLVSLGLAAVVGATALPLADYYRQPLATRPDQLAAVRLLESMARGGDAVVVDAYYATVVFEYYEKMGLPYVGLPATEPPDRAATEKALADLAAGHERLWAVYWQDYFTDGDHIVESWLDNNTLRFFDYPFQGWVRLKGYERRQPGETTFGGSIRLAGYEVTPRPLFAGQPATIKLYWQSLATTAKDYQVFVHVVDKDYRFVGQHDGPPDRGKTPTSVWRPGMTITDEHDFKVAADAPPGEYDLRVGLYALDDMKRLPTALGDNLLIGKVKVTTP
ncbi:MAG: glycosyltransferase family 39 protein [Chloroflexota bacterium]